MIVVLNDNRIRLDHWQDLFELENVPYLLFTHPNYLHKEQLMGTLPPVDVFIFDRFFNEKDFLFSSIFQEIRKKNDNENAKFVLSSASHDMLTKMKGYDLVMSQRPMLWSQLKELLYCN
jgi:hypothetical protein